VRDRGLRGPDSKTLREERLELGVGLAMRKSTTLFAILGSLVLGVLVLRIVMTRLGTTHCNDKAPTDILVISNACEDLASGNSGRPALSLAELVQPHSPARREIGASLPREPWGRE